MITRTHTSTPAEKKSSSAKKRAVKQVPDKKAVSDAGQNTPDIQSETSI